MNRELARPFRRRQMEGLTSLGPMVSEIQAEHQDDKQAHSFRELLGARARPCEKRRIYRRFSHTLGESPGEQRGDAQERRGGRLPQARSDGSQPAEGRHDGPRPAFTPLMPKR